MIFMRSTQSARYTMAPGSPNAWKSLNSTPPF
jgi:hypothetical protein